MFGYLDIDKTTLEQNQQGLWQSFMCAMCFSTKKLFGNVARTYVTNDLNFFNVLFGSVTNTQVQLVQTRCFSHPVKKQTVIAPNELSDKMSVANVLFAYWNLRDDISDGASVAKRIAFANVKRSYRKARNLWTELDEVIANRTKQLSELEKSQCNVLDRVADSFAMLSQEFCTVALQDKATDYAKVLCYNVGKWVYLIDALDDFSKDIKRHEYNVFATCYAVDNVSQLATHYDEIQFEMFAVLNRIAQSFNDLNLTEYTCVLRNILLQSIRNKTQQVLEKIKITE